ncbi:hypothetical protein [Nocardia sp. NPDC057227]|uniref:hypothetical protein n=1 Tax=Nocardia sp. NPDC057227 TaxID=3346056 RepID=UPI00363A4302
MSLLHNLAADLPEFNDDPTQRLAHTLAAYNDSADEAWAIRATGGRVVHGHDVTGITWGDLRALLAQLQANPPA